MYVLILIISKLGRILSNKVHLRAKFHRSKYIFYLMAPENLIFIVVLQEVTLHVRRISISID